MSKLEKYILNTTQNFALDMLEVNDNKLNKDLTNIEVLFSLYGEMMNYKADKPQWINRDRLIFSDNKNTNVLYATLFMAGFKIEIDDLQNYGRINFKTPFKPDYKITPGVDASTDGVGVSIATAVGVSLAENYLSNLIKEIKPKSKLIDYYTYCLCNEFDLMEGVSNEALTFAVKNNLNKLILICHIRNILDENITLKFNAMSFNVLQVKKNKIDDICSAIENAQSSKKPTIILINSINEEVIDFEKEPFLVDQDILNKYQAEVNERVNKKYNKWLIEYEEIINSKNEPLTKIIRFLEHNELNINLENINFKIEEGYKEKLSVSNEKIMEVILNKTEYFIGGCSQSFVNKFSKYNFLTNENAMAGILNGFALSGFRVYACTNLSYSDYLKPNLRMSAKMNLPITYIFNQNNLYSENGFSIEHISALRLIPNVNVFRPSDINEVIGSWDYVLKNGGVNVIITSDEELYKYKNTNSKYVKYGAYMIRKEIGNLKGVLIATGTDIKLALRVADELSEEGIEIRVVSMPSMELFLKQNPRYEEQLLPSNVKIFTLEMGSPHLWHRFASNKDTIIGINKLEKSGHLNEIKNEFGFTITKIKDKIKKELYKTVNSTDFL